MKTQVKTVFSCKAFLQKRRLSLVLFAYCFKLKCFKLTIGF